MYITNGITVRSVNGFTNTIVNGNSPLVTNRCFAVSHSNAVLDGFTIIKGLAAFSNYPGSPWNKGGGVYLSTGLVQNCLIATNVLSTWGSGGGVYIYKAGVVSNCTISSNVAQYGGGVYLVEGGIVKDGVISSNLGKTEAGGFYLLVWNSPFTSPLVTNCLIINNRTEPGQSGSGGGGSVIYGGIVKQCTIISNQAYYGGGLQMSIYSMGTNNLVQNCVISYNSATNGGGVLFSFGDPGATPGTIQTMQNCLIVSNTSLGNGGGIYFNSACTNATVCSCTIVKNIANTNGGGIFFANITNTVQNSIVYGNSAIIGTSSNYNSDANPIGVSFSCLAPAPGVGSGNIASDPRFMPTGGGDRLAEGSPCINAGLNQSWMTNAVDLAGTPRIFRNIVDLGAYEYYFRGTIFMVH